MKYAIRFVVAAIATISLLSALLPESASATTSAHRTRSATSRWAPQTSLLTVSPYNGPFSSYVAWDNIRWGDPAHYEEAEGLRRAMEWKTDFPTGYVNGYGSYSWSNFPSASRPYRDTGLSDFGSSVKSYGYGVASPQYLGVGVNYNLGYVVSANSSGRPLSGSVRARVVAASDVGDDATIFCGAGIQFCTFPDYTFDYLRARSMTSYTDRSVSASLVNNYLYNQSFEQNDANYAVNSGNNRSIYCGSGWGFNSNCFLEFNRGSAPQASVRQDVNFDVRAGDNYTAEAMLRCPVNQGSCPVVLAYWGLGGSSESRNVSVGLPSDGQWYMCHVDFDHGASSGFASNHNMLRFEVYNNFGGNLDVDFTTLALAVQRTPNTQGDVNPKAAVTGNCVLHNRYNY